jgi:glucose/arabinose dehydrogenase
LGSIIRLDVDVSDIDISNGITYRIPDGNPYAMSTTCATGCPEIFAIGLRNPWRFSFDTVTGDLYTGDVGQNAREEIDLITVGGNYGWRCYEASLPYNTGGCLPAASYISPVAEYARTLGNSVTGGYVYRGTDYPALQGVYLYADYGSGRFWGLIGGKELGELVDTTLRPATFAQSNDGEVYVLDLWTGAIYQVTLPE